MIDFVIGAVLVALLVRGWIRGLLREAVGLAVVLVGMFLAFRLAGPAGEVIAAMSGTDGTYRLAGGVAVFLLLSLIAAVVLHLGHRGLRALPGATTLNRAGGAAFAAGAGLVVATLVLSLVTLVPVPAAVADRVEESALAAVLTDPDGPVQHALGALAGDHIVRTALALRELTGSPHLVATSEPYLLVRVDGAEVEPDPGAAEAAFVAVNRTRVIAGVDPLAWSDGLAELALERAAARARSGLMVVAEDVRPVLVDAGLAAAIAGEVAALAPTPEEAHVALRDHAVSYAQLVEPEYSRVGIGVVRTPLGLVVVELFAG